MNDLADSIERLAASIRLLALDVDGVLTDGSIIYTSDDHETKAFNVKDGAGIRWLSDHGVRVAIITARQSGVVERRARELGIGHVVQNATDKRSALMAITTELSVPLSSCAYMGDDLPDLGPLSLVALPTCPADAASDVQRRCLWRSQHPGGRGAVRELAELILRAQGQWPGIVERFEGEQR